MAAAPPARSVLIVDDDPGLLRLMERALRRAGFNTATAGTGAGALERLGTRPADLLLLDLKLPDMTGGDVIRRLAEQGRSIPFLIITGQGDERAAVEAMKQGALDYLVKDIRLLDFVPEMVRRAFARVDTDQRLAGAEAALRASAQALSEFFANAPISLLWVEPGGRVQRANAAALKLLELPDGEVLGQLVSEFSSEPGQVEELLGRLRARETVENHHAQLREHAGGLKHVLIDAQGLWEGEQLVRSHWFVRDITRRVELEHEILAISEREQRRFGQDLHDDLCQTLTGIGFRCESLAGELASITKRDAARVKELARMLREATSRAREMARGLAPMHLDEGGVVDALRELAERTGRIFRIDCEFTCQRPFPIRDETTGVHLYRIAQEAVGNAVKHGKPKRLVISLQFTSGAIVLAVEDDGRGFRPRPRKKQGIGIRIMQYRAGVIGGSLVVQRGPRGGTTVICRLKT